GSTKRRTSGSLQRATPRALSCLCVSSCCYHDDKPQQANGPKPRNAEPCPSLPTPTVVVLLCVHVSRCLSRTGSARRRRPSESIKLPNFLHGRFRLELLNPFPKVPTVTVVDRDLVRSEVDPESLIAPRITAPRLQLRPNGVIIPEVLSVRHDAHSPAFQAPLHCHRNLFRCCL